MSIDTSFTVPRPPRRRRIPQHWVWPVVYLTLAVAVFFLYFYLFRLPTSFQDFVLKWLPMSDVNLAVVWVIFALGLNIVVGYAGLLDLGFVAFWAIGGYVAGWIMSDFLGEFHHWNLNILGTAPPGSTGVHVNFWFVIIAGAAVCAFFGVLIGAPTLRLRSDYLALVTLGFGEIIPQVFRNGDNVGGKNISNGDLGITPVDQVRSVKVEATGLSIGNLGPFDLLSRYLVFVLLAAFMVFMSLRLREGRLGRAWLAIREDEVAASAMGVPLMRTKLAAYAIGAISGGLGGVAFATHVNSVLPSRFDFSISIILLGMVVLGGMGNVWGVILGALVLSWINSTGLDRLGRTLNESTGRDWNIPSYNFLLFGLVLILMMLFRREGLLPEARTRLVLREHEKTGVGQEALELDELDEQVPAGHVGEKT